ncbi:unnamed protein product [Rotaria socialis]|uniref:Uncharacterized protein n=1 Tax=Rotaria socialis TaxID=392032 RepID=A0A818C8Z7_9BILA|nr:unnamed protein product [Rotaria socialis]CAF3429429.1 unnamed protein product [Rotaria socialis]CAF3632599.1 unnamed protein product [Rotaria socialis]CAF3643202.1 unnamed protein product [Rotaria socialis]CAF4149954.1 unnamed protein product [Rotaria socialis]
MASIHQVILDGRLSQLNLLINKLGCNVNEKDPYGRTPLHLAVLSDQERYGYRVARLLLQGSADINATDSQQQTPLVYACLLNRAKLVALFLRTKSIDWRLVDHESYLIVHHAASSSQAPILSAIINEMKSIGLSMDCKTEMGYTPLILAIKSSRFDNAMFLIDHTDASPFAIDDEYHLTCEQWLQHVEPKLNEWAYYYQRRSLPIRRKPSDKCAPNYKCFYGVESPYKSSMLVCNHLHVKSFEESTYTPAILSPRNENRKMFSTNFTSEQPNNPKLSYQIWMQLVQRLRDRTLTSNASPEERASAGGRYSHSVSQHTSPSIGIRREKTWAGQESISPWYNATLNSNRQVVSLINHYSNMLSAENNDRFMQGLNDRPKSILRPIGSPAKFRLTKEVTFATN